jgi:hypothetical protein
MSLKLLPVQIITQLTFNASLMCFGRLVDHFPLQLRGFAEVGLLGKRPGFLALLAFQKNPKRSAAKKRKTHINPWGKPTQLCEAKTFCLFFPVGES